jgi:hypothetical protein
MKNKRDETLGKLVHVIATAPMLHQETLMICLKQLVK